MQSLVAVDSKCTPEMRIDWQGIVEWNGLLSVYENHYDADLWRWLEEVEKELAMGLYKSTDEVE